MDPCVVGGIELVLSLCITSFLYLYSGEYYRVKLGDFAWMLCTSVVILSHKQTSYQFQGSPWLCVELEVLCDVALSLYVIYCCPSMDTHLTLYS
jgi:hypothetical protein